MLSRPYDARSAELIGRHLKTIGSPVRIRIVDALDRCGELSVTELAIVVDVSGEDASQHLALLRRAGIVQWRRVGKKRLYSLNEDAAVEIYALVVNSLKRRAAAAAGEPELL